MKFNYGIVTVVMLLLQLATFEYMRNVIFRGLFLVFFIRTFWNRFKQIVNNLVLPGIVDHRNQLISGVELGVQLTQSTFGNFPSQPFPSVVNNIQIIRINTRKYGWLLSNVIGIKNLEAHLSLGSYISHNE